MMFYPRKKEVIVNTKTNKSFKGILWRMNPAFLVLKNTKLLDGKEIIPVDGEVVILRGEVDFIQVI